ncbi:MAG: tRNA threonylcarbamoyladenosine dehydratase [Clostridiales bacterium]|nr:tRNA threonylcarbamoyladenosine dehydratase [Clostridiales bacterium]
MNETLTRTAALIGEKSVEKLKNARVIVFGLGGVGGYTAEALARSGVGSMDIVDNDVFALSNINRQIGALHSTIGRRKTEVMAERLRDINPELKITAHELFVLPENVEQFDFSAYDYVVDAIDTVKSKIAIIERAKMSGVPVLSAMGAGNKLDPTKFKAVDISKTSVCPLARAVRQELKKRGINDVKVVYSEETPAKTDFSVPASIVYATAVMGLLIAKEVIDDLICK